MIMEESDFLTLLNTAYTRSEVAYEIGILKIFLEFAFFTEHVAQIGNETVKHFLEQKDIDLEEKGRKFLQTLPENFLGSFREDNFYEKLNKFSERDQSLPVLSMVVPLEFSLSEIEGMGKWARQNVDPTVLIDMDVDPSISVGCRLVWNDRLHDFSLAYYLQAHKEALHAELSQKMKV